MHDALESVVAVGSDDGVFVGERHTRREERRVVQTLVASVFFGAESQICEQLLEKLGITYISFDGLRRIFGLNIFNGCRLSRGSGVLHKAFIGSEVWLE